MNDTDREELRAALLGMSKREVKEINKKISKLMIDLDSSISIEDDIIAITDSIVNGKANQILPDN